jgi:seryl-tRNA synthetase
MLDLKFIRENPDQVIQAAKAKGVDLDLDKILDLDQRRREQVAKVDALRSERRRLSEKVKTTRDQKSLKKAKTLKSKLQGEEKLLRSLEKDLNQALTWVPNIPAGEVPVGSDETKNEVVKTWGEAPTFDFKPKDHLELGQALDLIDLKRGAKIAGPRGYFLKKEAVFLELGLMLYSLDYLVKKGFTPLLPPVLVKESCLFGTGWLPWGREENYQLSDKELFLAATAEVPVTAYHSDEVLDESELPKLYVAFSPCFRREAGSYGKDVKGLYRLHQFNKVEQLVICRHDMDESRHWHEVLLKNAEEIMQDLHLPYRVVLMCTGDMGQPQVKKYDIETWMPGRNAYGETQSDSIMGDFQARRLKIRYREKNGEIKFAHTLNNTVVASPRILIAILENYQQEDGSVVVPEILRPFVGKDVINPEKSNQDGPGFASSE